MSPASPVFFFIFYFVYSQIIKRTLYSLLISDKMKAYITVCRYQFNYVEYICFYLTLLLLNMSQIKRSWSNQQLKSVILS